jgi:hypothetical protein
MLNKLVYQRDRPNIKKRSEKKNITIHQGRIPLVLIYSRFRHDAHNLFSFFLKKNMIILQKSKRMTNVFSSPSIVANKSIIQFLRQINQRKT